MTSQSTSNPASTGGAGTFFEQHVAAYWLVHLLVRGIPPVLIETIVSEVHFQTEHLGWHTDDFLIVCDGPSGSVHKLVGQVKRSFTVSAADDSCKSAIQDFWNDFKTTARFSQKHDRLILVTLRGTNTLLEHFVGLLDCARAARDAAEFEHRLTTKGFISKTAVHYCDEISKIIAAIEGRPVTAADIWLFLRRLHVLSLDLHTSTRQTESQIKNLLAHTLVEGDNPAAADVTWNALLVVASTAISEAQRLRHADLPTELQQRHRSLGVKEHNVLRRLRDHTAPVLRGIRSTIGQDFHLQRASLVQNAINELETGQVVLVSGPAGSGKSVICKDIVSLLSQDHFVFGFRAEEFAQPHIDTTLLVGQIPTNAETLATILSTQGRKVVLVESVERLLEKATRDAFSDLMALAAADRSMGILLTCRDYSVEQVRASFLQPAMIKHAVVNVPPLDDTELTEIEKALPALAHPLKNPALRNILRNPYFLDKALDISWSAERSVPENEREFRALFWRQIVRADHGATGGMARRREEAFHEIAVRRARSLSTHVMCSDLDPAAVSALRQDSLIVTSDENPSLVATAHDVLEDWAILQWLEEQQLTDEGSFESLSATIGAHPAIRRSYRKWVAELVENDPSAADRLFTAAITETEISVQFRDDTLISLLMASSSPDLLTRHEAELLANNKIILERVIHLLRVACVKTPTWLTSAVGYASILNVPDGPAWTTVLSLVHKNIASFTPEERPLLLGLIENAVREITWWAPELDGAECVAGIGHWLLAGLDDYGAEDSRKRVLKVIAKIPKADPARFEAVLRGTEREGRRRDLLAENFRDLLFSGIEGAPAARDLPELVVELAKDYLLASESDLRQDYYSRSSLELETYFGIKERLGFLFSPASALRGPWIPLLRYHPRQALDFFIHIFNYSVDWYVHPRRPDPLEPAWEIKLTFADGTTRSQWGNPRLWNLYRGTSVGPDVLQSLLMAFEKWLLEFAHQQPSQLDGVLLAILCRSDSAALAAVVASVATAYPNASGEALLVLLTAPDYIRLDRARMAGEAQVAALTGLFPQLLVENKIYEDERKEANGLPHRTRDLEAAIGGLQLGPLAPRVHRILDGHLKALPPNSAQEESDLMWRLAIHRMDLRQYTVVDTDDSEPPGVEANDRDSASRYIRLEPKVPDPDLQAMVDESVAEASATNARLGVLMWGLQIFERKDGGYDPSLWQSKLAEARAIDREVDQGDGSQHAPGVVAAVCVRDHWEEMNADERVWCVHVVCSEILRRSDQWSHFERIQRFSTAADRPCAAVVALLLSKSLSNHDIQRVREAFTAAITHPTEEVRWYATWSIDRDFWATDPKVAMRCVNVIATEAALLDEALEAQQTHPYEQRRQFDDIAAVAAKTVRERFWREDGIAENAHTSVDMSAGFGADRSARMLAILGQVPNESSTLYPFVRASRTLVDWWDTDDDRTHRRSRNFEAEYAVSEHLQQFVMRTTPAAALQALRPVLDAIDRHPREICRIIRGLTKIEDRNPNTEQYWYLWRLFADGVKTAKWATRLDEEHPIGGEMLSAIFLTSWWKDDVRHWRSLEGHAQHVHDLFEALAPSWTVLENYLSFLYHIGEQSLPAAFVRVADSLRGDPQAMLRTSNIVFMLEVLLQRHVYGRPLELKRNTEVRRAVLSLLDILVENGSSAAFRMRDDFVTPAA